MPSSRGGGAGGAEAGGAVDQGPLGGAEEEPPEGLGVGGLPGGEQQRQGDQALRASGNHKPGVEYIRMLTRI
jgi:hypothetical protein